MVVSASVEEFYAGIGQRLIDTDCYPVEIIEHLYEEKATLKTLLENSDYDTAVEVGCMDGTMHMDICIETKVNYVGIDLIEKSTRVLQEKLAKIGYSKHTLVQALDVLNIADIAVEINKFGRNVLVFFPFNSFGNLAFAEKAVDAIIACGYDIAVLTYRDDKHTTQVRHKYYSNCEYQNLTCSQDDKGIRFSATQGLNTYAYSKVWMNRLAQQHNAHLVIKPMGSIGCCYWFKNPIESQSK